MADPGTWAVVGTVLSAVTTGISAISQYRQGQYEQSAAGYSAAQAGISAREQDELAADARKRGSLEIAQHREDVKRLKSQQEMSYLASGVQLQGSALDLLADTNVQARLDEDIIKYNVESEARGYESKARSYRSEAGLLKYQGRQAATGGKIKAASSLLSGASKYAYRRSYVKK